ncbi:uncharacterized protein LOC131207164 [Anopheles bellator]|uniref:uncharacterized protein LOC131207164 n=1 Tax=Anopheles bellator TaxID=139047 RepID=UPI0026477AFC|nr:uncharacterized protein LOC131207164 [Anopheles bellator]
MDTMSPERTLSPDEDESSSDAGSSDHLIEDETALGEQLGAGSAAGAGSSSNSSSNSTNNGVSGGAETIIGGHVTVETSSPIGSPAPELELGPGPAQPLPTGGKPYGSSMVLSTIPLDAVTSSQLILQPHTGSNIFHPSPQQLQQQQPPQTLNNNNTSFKNHNNSSNGSGGVGGKNILINTGGNGHHHPQLVPHPHTTMATMSGGAILSSSIVPSPASPGTSGGGLVVLERRAGGPTMTTTGGAPPSNGTAIPPPGSKLVLLHTGGGREDYITDAIGGVGNIVLLATEQMDMAEHDIINNNVIISASGVVSNGSSSTTPRTTIATVSSHQLHPTSAGGTTTGVPATAAHGDEELTSLTWLQDENLLKGINLSKVPVSSPDSPRQVAGVTTGTVGGGVASGRLSPTSDFIEDSSSVSEDNTSSANSSSDHGNSTGTYHSETTTTTAVLATPEQQQRTTSQHTFQLGAAGHAKTITGINGETIIEYPVIAVNHHHPVGASNGHAPQQQQVVIDGSKTMKMTLVTATSGIDGATSTTVPFAVSSSSMVAGGSGAISYVVSSPANSTSSAVPIASSTPVSSSGNGNGSSKSNSSSTNATPHQHFHKKYLREELVKQQQQEQQQQQQQQQVHQPKHSMGGSITTIANGGVSGGGTANVNSVFLTPLKQQINSALKYEDGIESGEDRSYHHLPPAAPMKNGSTSYGGSSSTMSSPNVSGEEYGGTTVTTVYGGLNLVKQSPAASPSHNGSASNGTVAIMMNGASNQHHQIQHLHPTQHHHHQQQHHLQHHLQHQPQLQHASPSVAVQPSSSSSVLSMPSSPQGGASTNSAVSPSKLPPPKAKHPTNVPYDPLVHVNNKPPFSFSSLIFMAIENSQQKALPVKEIYAWIVQHFPYFKTAPTGWKNSVRHNLSLNKCFQKVEKAANLGKGSLWMVEPQFRPNLIQALSRSPFHAGSGIDKATYKSMQQQQRSTNASPTGNGAQYSKQDNFPQLASRLAPSDAQNGLLHDDPDDLSRSSTPIDYDGGGSDLSAPVGSQHHTTHYPQHHHTQPPPQQQSVHHGHGIPQQHSMVRGGLLVTESPNVSGDGYHLSSDGTISEGGIVQCATGLVYVNGSGGTSGLPKEIVGREWSADTIEDVNAATAMLALKHGPKIFIESSFRNGNPPVITTSPSEDHTYSAGGASGATGLPEQSTAAPSTNGSPLLVGNGSSCCSSSDERYEHSRPHHLRHPPLLSHLPQHHASQHHSDNISNGTSSDAAYESSEESHPHHASAAADMEERRRQESVYALLNLAQMTYSSSPSSSMSSSTSTLSSPASSTGSLKRSAPNDSYTSGAGIHNSYHHQRSQLVASPDDRMRIANAASPLHPHNGHVVELTGAGGGPSVTTYYGGVQHLHAVNGSSANKVTSDDLSQRYTSPPPAKKSKARTALKKLKKKSWAR